MPQTPRRVDKKQKRYERWGFILTSCRVHVSTFLCFISPSQDGSAVDLCAIHDTTKLLNDDAALDLFLSVFFDTLHEYEAITTLSPIPGQAALRGGSGCSTRKALPGKRRVEVFFAIHDTIRLLDDDAAGCWVTTQRGHHFCRSGVSGHAHADFLSMCFCSCGWQDT